jgi:hypothetical protein
MDPLPEKLGRVARKFESYELRPGGMPRTDDFSGLVCPIDQKARLDRKREIRQPSSLADALYGRRIEARCSACLALRPLASGSIFDKSVLTVRYLSFSTNELIRIATSSGASSGDR